MNKIEQIESFSRHFNMLAESSARAWEKDQSGSTRENDLAKTMESMCLLLGIEIDWPGLYPSFKVNGYTYYSIDDALAARAGHVSFGCMKHDAMEEAKERAAAIVNGETAP